AWCGLSESASLEGTVEAGVDVAGVALENGLALRIAEVDRRVDVLLGVVEVVTGTGVDVTDSADHLAREQDVLGRDDVGQQVDAWLVVDAVVDVDVVEQVLLDLGLAECHRERAEATPVVRNGSAAVRDDELQVGEVLEQGVSAADQ